MAKKKGGGGATGASKKSEQKKKQQSIEDKTFGLKNKNKSKKVQQHVKSIERNVMNSGDPKQRKLEEQRRKAKADAKARKVAMKEEQNALFGEALLAVQKKSKINQSSGKVEAKGRDADDDATKSKGTSKAMKMMFQMDAQEMSEKLKEDPNYVPTIEDEIDMQRQKKVEELTRLGKGTKVTPETFAAWKERKRKQREEANMKLVQQELKKKKGGKGLSVLTGRDMYNYKKDLFDKFDDDDDDNVQGAGAGGGGGDTNNANNNSNTKENGDNEAVIDDVAAKVKSDLFLQGDDGDDDDLDDLLDD